MSPAQFRSFILATTPGRELLLVLSFPQVRSILVLVSLLQFLAENLPLVQFESLILAKSPARELLLVLVFPQMQSRNLPLLRLSLLMVLEIPFAPQLHFLVTSHLHELLPPLLLRQRQPFPV